MRLTPVLLLLLVGLAVGQATPSQFPQNPCPTVVPSGKALSEIKRIYVESFGDDPISKEMQAMVVDSLTKSKVFAVTENRDKADAILKGSTLEKTSQEAHSYSDSTAVGTMHGSSSGSLYGTIPGTISGSSSGSISVTTANDARASVRLVNGDGDVIWTTTQESKGAKYKGASADVANKIVKQLIWDVAKPKVSHSAPVITPVPVQAETPQLATVPAPVVTPVPMQAKAPQPAPASTPVVTPVLVYEVLKATVRLPKVLVN